MQNKLPIIGSVLLSLSSMGVMAATDGEFQHQLSANHFSTTENFDEGDWGLNYSYFANPVKENNGPYALNSFLAQETNVNLNYSDSDLVEAYGGSARYVFDSKFFIGAGYSLTEYNDWNEDSKSYSAQLGYFLNDSTSVAAFYGEGDDDDSFYGMNIQSFVALESTSGVLLSGGIVRNEGGYVDNDSLSLGADWYLTKAWSVGAIYSYYDNDFYSNDSFSIGSAYWLKFSELLSGSVSLIHNLDSELEEDTSVNLSLIARF